jgi:hypothetical protein
MLELYHLFPGAALTELAGIDAVMQEAGTVKLPIRPPRRSWAIGYLPAIRSRNRTARVVRTLWGELAWQLGYAAGGDRGEEGL